MNKICVLHKFSANRFWKFNIKVQICLLRSSLLSLMHFLIKSPDQQRSRKFSLWNPQRFYQSISLRIQSFAPTLSKFCAAKISREQLFPSALCIEQWQEQTLCQQSKNNLLKALRKLVESFWTIFLLVLNYSRYINYHWELTFRCTFAFGEIIRSRGKFPHVKIQSAGEMGTEAGKWSATASSDHIDSKPLNIVNHAVKSFFLLPAPTSSFSWRNIFQTQTATLHIHNNNRHSFRNVGCRVHAWDFFFRWERF